MAELDLGVGTGPEVDADLGPHLGGMHISEDHFVGVHIDGIESKSAGSHVVEAEVLHGWVKGTVPIATDGSSLNRSWKV